MQLTLIADAADVAATPHDAPSGYLMREATRADVDSLGALYFASYPAGVAGATVEEATADISAAFDGDYGALWLEASLVAERGGDLVGAIQVVRRAPWDDVPPAPFIIELFVAAEHRRVGLARRLVTASAGVTRAAGESAMALRVDGDNTPALTLYRALGFADRDPRRS